MLAIFIMVILLVINMKYRSRTDIVSQILEAAKNGGATVAVGYCTRFRNNVLLLKRLLQASYFGRVTRFVHQAGTVGGWAPRELLYMDHGC